jgi:hypothetical protein
MEDTDPGTAERCYRLGKVKGKERKRKNKASFVFFLCHGSTARAVAE